MQTFPRMPVRVHIRAHLTHGSRAVLLCAIGLCAIPQLARAQQPNSVPVLGNLPLIGRLYQTQPGTSIPILSDLPIIGTLYRVQPKMPGQVPAPSGQIVSPGSVSIEAKNATLGSVIEQLMDSAHLSYTLDATLEQVRVGSFKLRKVPFQTALRTILKSAAGRATYVYEDSIYRILPQEVLDGERQTQPTPVPAPTQAPGERDPKLSVEVVDNSLPPADAKFNIEVSDASLYQALKLLFAQAHLSYMVDPSLRNYHVTAHIRNQDFRATLETLLKASGHALTYRVEGGIYQVVPRAETRNEGVKP